MKHLFLGFALSAVLAAPALAGQSQTLQFFIPAMTGCPSCPYIIESVLNRIDGVSKVETVYETGVATIVYDDAAVTPKEISNALFEYGYDAEPVAPEG